MSQVGIGVIGCGRISENHFRALAKLPEVKSVCVADVNPEAAQSKAEKHGAAKWVTDYHQLLAVPEVEAEIAALHAGFWGAHPGAPQVGRT